MMSQKQKTDIYILQALFTDMRFESLFNAVDRLHDAASSGKVAEVTNLSTDDVIGWLRDIVYTANETINELGNPDNVASAGPWDALADTRETWSVRSDQNDRRA